MHTRKILLLLSMVLFWIPSAKANDPKRQELPSEKGVHSPELKEEVLEEPEEKPIPGEVAKVNYPTGLKSFYQEHISIILGLYEEWDSNIFLDEADEEDDFITIVNPDVIAHFGGDNAYLEAEWIGRYGYYLDSGEFTVANSISGLTFFRPSDVMGLGLKGSYDRTEDSDVTTFFGDRILQLGYDIISLQPGFKLEIAEQLRADLSYSFDDVDIRDSGLDDEIDRQGHGFSSTLEYDIIPRTTVLGGYAFRDVKYSEDPFKNSFSNLISAGIRHEIPSLLNIELKFIYDDKDFESSPDDQNVDISGSIATIFSRYTTLIFNGFYGLQESSRGEFTQYTSTKFFLSLQHYLTSKIAVTLRGGYELQAFDANDLLVTSISEDQDTVLYNLSVGVRRSMLDWLSLELIYTFQERDTDFVDEDLQDHVIHTGVRAYF